MKQLYRIGTITLVWILALLLGGCVLLAPTPEPLATPTAASVEETTPRATAEAAAPDATEEPTQAAVEEPAADLPRAAVLSAKLNIRRGPGTNYPIVSTAQQGDQFEVVGQTNSCRWLLVRIGDGDAWISGGAQFSQLNVACAAVPEAPIPAAPEATATTAAVPTAPAEPAATAALQAEPTAAPATAAPTEEPSAAQEAPVADALPAEQGCYLFQNQLGPEITITLTSRDGSWTDTFRLQPNEERPYCLPAGRYDYTLDAPPPWGTLNDTIQVNAGDRFYFPIRPKE